MKIVAPAGNMKRLYAAIKGSADEIYLGLKGFGARRNAENFTLDELKNAIDYAHLRGSKIFLTLNTVMTNSEIELLYPTLKELYNYGLDAIIVQDIGYAKYLHENFPKIEIHGSTQMTIGNYHEINYLKTLGFKRIVLPREMTLEEIKEIRENTDVELEIFVSGSLCISISGNCYISSFIGGRSGNRGMCAQPCRKEYIDSCGNKSFFLSPKDQLQGFEEIQKLKEIGVDSIKIEGRMKEVNYVYETVKYYRALIDGENVEEKSSKLFNRGYSKGYFYGNNSESIMNRAYSKNMGEKIGEVISKNKILLSDNLIFGDGISYISKDFEILGGTYISKFDIDNVKENRNIAHKDEKINLEFPLGTKYIFKNYNKRVNDIANKEIKTTDKKLSVNASFIAKIGEEPYFKIFLQAENRILFEVENRINYKTEKAQKKAISSDDIKTKLSETGDSEILIESIDIDIDENIFIPLSELKNLKRIGIESFREKLLSYFKRDLDSELLEKKKTYFKLNIEKDNEKEIKNIVIVSTQEQFDIIDKYRDKYNIEQIYFRTYDLAKQSKLSEHNLKNPLASNFYELLKNENDKVLLNWNMNIVNSYSINVLKDIKKLDTIIISPEINFTKIRDLGKTRLKKAILIYSKLKGMTIDIELSDKKEDYITNKEGDKLNIIKNNFGTELFLDKPLNIINISDDLKKLNVDYLVIELTNEKKEEILQILKQLNTKKGEYREYNYKRGVY